MHDTLAPPPADVPPPISNAPLSLKDFRGVYTRASKLLEPLCPSDRRRILAALNALAGDA